MKKINVMLRKCKTLSKQLGRTSSNLSFRSKSARHLHDGASAVAAAAAHGGGGGIIWNTNAISAVYDGNVDVNGSGNEEDEEEQHRDIIVFVGSTKKRYVISSKYLSHPLVNALIEKSNSKKSNSIVVNGGNEEEEEEEERVSSSSSSIIMINCEVVLFDHLLWMLENADFNVSSDCLDELADLYSS